MEKKGVISSFGQLSEEAQAAAHIFLKEEFTTSSSSIEATHSTPATELELFAEFVKTQ